MRRKLEVFLYCIIQYPFYFIGLLAATIAGGALGGWLHGLELWSKWGERLLKGDSDAT